MPRPESTTTILRQDLNVLAMEYALVASQRGFIGSRVLPIFPTGVVSAKYPVIRAKELLKLPNTRRAPTGAYNRGSWEFGEESFNCLEYGHEEPVDETTAKLYAQYFDAEEIAVMRATDILLRGYEKRVADVVMGSSFAAHNVDTAWSTLDTSTPREDVKDGIDAILAATGIEPNVLILSRSTFMNACDNAAFVDHVQYTTPSQTLTMDQQRVMLAAWLRVPEIIVGNSIYDTAKEGQAMVPAGIWPDAFGMLARIGTNARDLKEACIGRTFQWTGDGGNFITTEQYRDDKVRSDIYRARMFTGEVVMFAAAGYKLGNLA